MTFKNENKSWVFGPCWKMKVHYKWDYNPRSTDITQFALKYWTWKFVL